MSDSGMLVSNYDDSDNDLEEGHSPQNSSTGLKGVTSFDKEGDQPNMSPNFEEEAVEEAFEIGSEQQIIDTKNIFINKPKTDARAFLSPKLLEKLDDISRTILKEPTEMEEEKANELKAMLSFNDDSDMFERVVAPDIRGKKFKVSHNGKCPRCNNSKNVFVILDFIFPMGEMPDICTHLIAKGQAVLWSSQDDSHCKDPPTFLCRGRCPSDPAKCGFNLNWNKVGLEDIFLYPERLDDEESVLKANNQPQKPTIIAKATTSTSQKIAVNDDISCKGKQSNIENVEENSNDCLFDEGEIDLHHYKQNVSWVVLDEVNDSDEPDVEQDKLIRTMLALSDAKKDWHDGVAKLWSHKSVDENLEEKDMEVSDEEGDFSKNSQTSNKHAYAFSWDTYGGNPWSVSDISKEKNQNTMPDIAVVNKRSDTESSLLINTGIPSTTDVFSSSGLASGVDSSQNVPPDNCSVVSNDKVESSKLTDETIEANETENETNDSKNEISSLNPTTQRNDLDEASVKENVDASENAAESETKSTESNQSNSASNKTTSETASANGSGKTKYTAADWPISSDGTCPYCGSGDVVYIIITNKVLNLKLPLILQRLLKQNFAYKMPKGDSDPPSFQCLSCTYGFNLDWRQSDLEQIFYQKLEDAENPPDPAEYDDPMYGGQSGYPQHYMAGSGPGFPPMGYGPGYYAAARYHQPMMGHDWAGGYYPPGGYAHGFMPYPMMPGPMPMFYEYGPGFAGQRFPGGPRHREMYDGKRRAKHNTISKSYHPQKNNGVTTTSKSVSKTDEKAENSGSKVANLKESKNEDDLSTMRVQTSTDNQPLPPGTTDSNTEREAQDVQFKGDEANTDITEVQVSISQSNAVVTESTDTQVQLHNEDGSRLPMPKSHNTEKKESDISNKIPLCTSDVIDEVSDAQSCGIVDDTLSALNQPVPNDPSTLVSATIGSSSEVGQKTTDATESAVDATIETTAITENAVDAIEDTVNARENKRIKIEENPLGLTSIEDNDGVTDQSQELDTESVVDKKTDNKPKKSNTRGRGRGRGRGGRGKKKSKS